MTTNAEEPATAIRAYPNGPILVRGDFELLDEDGVPVATDRRTVALCRCGRSAIAPLCDGTHSLLPRTPRS
ncbi:CDGSH iron-sulfur domain-containing protein [Kribbella sandramycini]|uniref:CDGSH iron-sulfur domain-containing protein n=1 Tax=Kribbella sandramycini TaxID=60450 RepID=A0A7Y4P2C8_9ACTN|nr:CDGSH iron-sulfur domain-containing protein [Kribbella sandramycini]MBB6570348.1 CDGSH-type Zn-finger protein [Kribbella sandramycini]NOL45212.1 CDGSH iron-sulfur domain-containing protein [Kribbella sandramycini]